eukprot:TRINITY_DN35011_c0_g1_i1.p1 TRINITY_DN35011_c0_g1~~TRINITY_DN35011_c0_g1_i1.p1  ORF type:complete len:146 (-),score=6.04 TRINITY_DN35011_c0_g1_i1:240-677(-)
MGAHNTSLVKGPPITQRIPDMDRPLPKREEEFESVMVPRRFCYTEWRDERKLQMPCMETDNPMLFLTGKDYSLQCTAADVMHSLSLPSFGIKIDCIPGRRATVRIRSNIPGIFSGQCSELCGAGHSRMPLHIVFGLPRDLSEEDL